MLLQQRLPMIRYALLGALALSCGDSPAEPLPDLSALRLRVVQVATGLQSPLHLVAPPGDARLFVVEQPGRIQIIAGGQLLPTPFLDISAKVSCCGERGLLGLAFHPRYSTNGFFYVNYTDTNGDTRVERYRVSADPNVADRPSAFLLIAIDQPFANHNGGLVAFGPDDMLYIGMGDGGGGGDPLRAGQDSTTLLGKLLRLDVDGGSPYRVPPSNPFAGHARARGEIWALGLRNPWRFAFDPATNQLYVADVGQNRLEEINVVDARTGALNYGWNVMEGTSCYEAATCNTTGKILPAVEYDHAEGCSVTGGYVYRGAAIPELRGHYFYSDYCQGWLRSFRYTGGAATDKRSWDVGDLGNVLSFGQDGAGELYVLSATGRVYRIAKVEGPAR